ncbi:hypothetical protein AGMMS49975_09110 [Clostridia bacterium]|nr:hypothetical protein AGMMS49975_09110 [Clostridia bacterium]
MNEEATGQVFQVSFQAAELTINTILKVLESLRSTIENQQKIAAQLLGKGDIQKGGGVKNPELQGKQKINRLVESGADIDNIKLDGDKKRIFESVARKYGMAYSLRKNSAVKPPQYTLFFKAKNTKVLNAAIDEMTQKFNKAQANKKTIESLLNHAKDVMKDRATDIANAVNKAIKNVRNRNGNDL